jgi:hypothetical protein
MPSGRGRTLKTALIGFLFAGPGALVWLGVGVALGTSNALRHTLALGGAGYGVGYGAATILGIRLKAPGSRWQIPAQWLRGRAKWQVWSIWGAILGPGAATRNPYLSFWLLLPLAVVTEKYEVAAFAGAAHGLGRALGIVRNVTHRCPVQNPATWGALRTWIVVDAAILLFAAGLLSAWILPR